MRIHHLLRHAVLIIMSMTAAHCGWAEVAGPAKRQAVVDLANQLLAVGKSVPTLPPQLVDPFNPPSFGAVPASHGKGPGDDAHHVVSDREVLEQIARRIDPSGIVSFNNQPMLLFGEKRLKVGDTLTITFDGKNYVVVVAAIDPTSFTIRLNREEITRPVNKPGNVQ